VSRQKDAKPSTCTQRTFTDRRSRNKRFTCPAGYSKHLEKDNRLQAWMNNNNTLDVVEWCDSTLPIAAGPRDPRRLGSPTLVGLLGTILIHALAVRLAYMGSRESKAQLSEIQVLGAPLGSEANSLDNLVLITLPSISGARETMSRDTTSQVTLTKATATSFPDLEPPPPLNIEIPTVGEEQPSQSTGDGPEPSEQARLFGIYTGQIRARVERIWRRPRTPVEQLPARANGNSHGKPFKCQVQIVQDATGNVQEVLLARCNGSAAWRRSLVIAVQQSSPLPAPPDPSVFSRRVLLSFIGYSYGRGANEDAYEILARNVTDEISR